MAKRKSKLQTAFEFAKENGIGEIEVDGIKLHVPQNIEQPETYSVPLFQKDQAMADVLLDDPFIGMSEEEILFFHSDYYDELQERKLAKEEALTKEKEVRDE